MLLWLHETNGYAFFIREYEELSVMYIGRFVGSFAIVAKGAFSRSGTDAIANWVTDWIRRLLLE